VNENQRRSPQWPPRNRFAFTLVELLITVAIISVLAALLSVACAGARERARRVVCINNLHQIGTYFDLYCQDNDGYYPPYAYSFSPGKSGNWVILVVPKKTAQTLVGGQEAQNVYVCPSDMDPLELDCYDEDGNPLTVEVSYAYNLVLFMDGYRTSTVPRPSDCSLAMDGDMQQVQGKWKDDPDWYEKVLELRHNGGVDILFCDQHVLWMKDEDITDDIMNP